ncbi:MAG: hypothetical protein U1C51_02455 [Candidatus Izemoplasmatales bacterium]|nr:hypothetical protein [bacterium]MDZ4196092.1 hypothetical protein [Candidatus Izemoplasmatales bacterium]
MCDTLIKRDESSFLFGKNSDRSANEPNLYLFIKGQVQTSKVLETTYIQIPQALKTFDVLLVQPSWMWGAEMGINQYGVVIGNEAIFTKTKPPKKPALLGMDLLRLALERSISAKDAINCMISLLETHGQGGNGGFDRHLHYDNTFIVADSANAFVLEMIGSMWAYKQIHDHANISNRIFLLSTVDQSSLQNQAFSKSTSNPLFTFFSGSSARYQTIHCELENETIQSTADLIQLLSSHQESDVSTLYTKGSSKSVCMHKSLLGDHTTASMIVNADIVQTTIWLSNGSTPCLSLYLPTYFGVVSSCVFDNKQDALDYWLKREFIKRAIYAKQINQESYLKKRNELQKMFLLEEESLRLKGATLEEYAKFQEQCGLLEQAWVEELLISIGHQDVTSLPLPRRWKKLSLRLGKHVFERFYRKRNQE